MGEPEIWTLECTSGREGSMGSTRVLNSTAMGTDEEPGGPFNLSMPHPVKYG
jgi:hypothetical protein